MGKAAPGSTYGRRGEPIILEGLPYDGYVFGMTGCFVDLYLVRLKVLQIRKTYGHYLADVLDAHFKLHTAILRMIAWGLGYFLLVSEEVDTHIWRWFL